MAFADIDHTQTVTFTFAFVTDSQDHERSPLRVKRGRAIACRFQRKGPPGRRSTSTSLAPSKLRPHMSLDTSSRQGDASTVRSCIAANPKKQACVGSRCQSQRRLWVQTSGPRTSKFPSAPGFTVLVARLIHILMPRSGRSILRVTKPQKLTLIPH